MQKSGPFSDHIQDVLDESKKIAKSHAVNNAKKKRMETLITYIETLNRGANSFVNNKVRMTEIETKIQLFIEDLVALWPVPKRDSLSPLINLSDVRPVQPYQEMLFDLGTKTYYIGPPGFNRKNEGKIANGGYVFIVPLITPARIRLGERAQGGHTAITRGADVYFAGEIFFKEGTLIEWNNESGHYQPSPTFHSQIGNLLPLDRYKERS